jgi:hypothetical protein
VSYGGPLWIQLGLQLFLLIFLERMAMVSSWEGILRELMVWNFD